MCSANCGKNYFGTRSGTLSGWHRETHFTYDSVFVVRRVERRVVRRLIQSDWSDVCNLDSVPFTDWDSGSRGEYLRVVGIHSDG